MCSSLAIATKYKPLLQLNIYNAQGYLTLIFLLIFFLLFLLPLLLLLLFPLLLLLILLPLPSSHFSYFPYFDSSQDVAQAAFDMQDAVEQGHKALYISKAGAVLYILTQPAAADANHECRL